MSEESLSKEQLLHQFAAAYERLIETATQAAQRASSAHWRERMAAAANVLS